MRPQPGELLLENRSRHRHTVGDDRPKAVIDQDGDSAGLMLREDARLRREKGNDHGEHE
jgi:hypothetical protein